MLYLYGASGHAKVIIEIAELNGYVIGGLVDDNSAITRLLGYPVGPSLPEDDYNGSGFVISIGNNRIRQQFAESRLHGKRFETVIHPQTAVSKSAVVLEGTVVMAGVSVNAGVKIGKHCIINTNASIDHDCVLDDFVHVSPNAALAGDVKVGEGTHIGIGACVIQGITIGKWCTVGAGAVVIRDVPDGATVVGNPARIITKN